MSAAFLFMRFILFAMLTVGAIVVIVWGGAKGIQGLVWLIGAIFSLIGNLFTRTGRFIKNTFADVGRSIGALLTAIVLLPLALLNLLFLRGRQARHYASALEDELISLGLGVYRVCLGNPLELVGLRAVTDGFERRLPEVVARAPRAPRASVKDGKFDGYNVTGVLPAGGSGARLFLATPRPDKLEQLVTAGYADPGQVVIKSFHLAAGSTMPQIVRESRALEAARQLGLVLEHELTDKSFFYVMPYVPGDSLDVVITQHHDEATPAGLSDRLLRVCLGYAGDLLYTLDAFHGGGLWHKDIKPSNLIVSNGRAHLVDLGLVTPLESAMTLTTHGTEYYRDPEMVRLALKGVKVHEVNGVKFDIYSTGAVIYSMIENSFPAQGSLSSIQKRCPEAVRWIVRRAMADLDRRYGSAQEMLADIRWVLAARDPFSVRPADLPSMGGKSDWTLRRASFTAGATARAATSSSPHQASRRAALHTATAVKQRRRSTGRSLAAAFVGTLFLLGVSGVALEAIHEQRAIASAEQAHLEIAGRMSDAEEFAPSSREDARAEATARRFVAIREAWSDKLGAEPALSKASSRPGDAPVGRVLILQDVRPDTDPLLVRGLRAELERRGLQVIGAPEDGIGQEEDILYAASARKVLGLSQLGDPQALPELEQFLAEHPTLDALFWVASGDDENSLEYRVIRPRSRQDVGAPATFVLASEQ